MEKDMLVTLDDNTNYVLLDDTIIDDNKYFFAVRIDNETKNPTNEYEVFEEEIEDDDTYLSALEESEFKQAVMLDFLNNYMNSIDEESI